MTKTDYIESLKEIKKELRSALAAAERLLAFSSIFFPDSQLSSALNNLSDKLESLALRSRILTEQTAPRQSDGGGTPCHLPDVTGRAEVNEYGWLHVALNTLLPHTRYQSTAYLSDSIIRILDQYEKEHRRLPRFYNAFLVIDEHCNIENRQVFDQDNKGWKAIPNALKGRVFEDDDQFSLHLSLISTLDDKPGCHIYVMDQQDADDFFALRYGGFSLS